MRIFASISWLLILLWPLGLSALELQPGQERGNPLPDSQWALVLQPGLAIL